MRQYRSKVGDLDTDDNTRQLKNQLADLGLQIKDMTGDGNCLFRALSDQMHGDASQHHSVRQKVCDHIESHSALYAPFLDEGTTVESYAKQMRKNGVFGGNLEIVACARDSNVDIAVHQADSPIWIVSGALEDESGANSNSKAPAAGSLLAARPVLHIAYHSWEHYSSIRNLDGPWSGSPNIVIRQQQPAAASGSGSSSQSAKDTKKAWDRSPDEPPTKMETTIMHTTGVTDLQKVRLLLAKHKGDPNRVMDVIFEELAKIEETQESALDLGDDETREIAALAEAAGLDLWAAPTESAASSAIKTGEASTTEFKSSTASPVTTNAQRNTSQSSQSSQPSQSSQTKSTKQTSNDTDTLTAKSKHISGRQKKEMAKKLQKEKALEKKRGKSNPGSHDSSDPAASTSLSNTKSDGRNLVQSFESIRI
eukprot:jgi/Hompol1/668/HPOL_000980-RA